MSSISNEDFNKMGKEVVSPVGQMLFEIIRTSGPIPVQEQIVSNPVGNWLAGVNLTRNDAGKTESMEETFAEYTKRLQTVLKAIKIGMQSPTIQSVTVEEKSDRKGRIRVKKEGAE